MNTTATCIDFEKILFDDLTAEKPRCVRSWSMCACVQG